MIKVFSRSVATIRLALDQNAKFQEVILEIRKILGIPAIGFSTEKEEEEWWHSSEKRKNIYFNNVHIFTRLRNSLGLSSRWEMQLMLYALNNKWSIVMPLFVEIRKNDFTGEEEAFLQIFGDTSIADIKRNWKGIQSDMKNLRERNKSAKGWEKRERDIFMFMRFESGMTPKNILSALR
ncbi:MAG: hypothetical protein WC304_03765, partial [Candidatus Gracilibacteria bacterium]